MTSPSRLVPYLYKSEHGKIKTKTVPSWKETLQARAELLVYLVCRRWVLRSPSKLVLKIPLPPVPLMLCISTALCHLAGWRIVPCGMEHVLLVKTSGKTLGPSTLVLHKGSAMSLQSLLALVFRSYCYMTCDSSKLDSPPTQVQILPKIDSSRPKYKKFFAEV